MKFEFRLTLKDVQEVIKIRNKKILMIFDVSIGVSILFVLLRFAQIVIMNVNAPIINIFITKIVPHIIECIILYVLARFIQYLFIRRAWENSHHWKYDFCVETIDKGLLISTFGEESKIQWSMFTHYKETKNLFILYLSPNYYNLFPKRAFNNEEVNEFRELIVKNI